MKLTLSIVAGILLAPTALAPAAPNRAPKPKPVVPDKQVTKAIEGSIKYLRGRQLADGSWEVDLLCGRFKGGWTSLALLALLNAGIPPEDKMIEKGLEWLRRQDVNQTYVKALQTAVYTKAGQGVDKARIQKNVDWLIKYRVKKDGRLLGWTYPIPKTFPDNSNTQYAVLGLHAGRQAGATIPKEIWKEIHDLFLDTQLKNGGFSYNRSEKSLAMDLAGLPMDVAGFCCLFISGTEMKVDRAKLIKDARVDRCLRKIGTEFTVKCDGRIYHNLYGLARAGRLSGLAKFGNHDWYAEGCKYLVKEQAEDGSWPDPAGHRAFDQWPVINTSFALLFLAK